MCVERNGGKRYLNGQLRRTDELATNRAGKSTICRWYSDIPVKGECFPSLFVRSKRWPFSDPLCALPGRLGLPATKIQWVGRQNDLDSIQSFSAFRLTTRIAVITPHGAIGSGCKRISIYQDSNAFHMVATKVLVLGAVAVSNWAIVFLRSNPPSIPMGARCRCNVIQSGYSLVLHKIGQTSSPSFLRIFRKLSKFQNLQVPCARLWFKTWCFFCFFSISIHP